MRKHVNKGLLSPPSDMQAAARNHGYQDAKNGVSLGDNFFVRIRSSSTFKAGYWDAGWHDYHRTMENRK